MKLFKVTSKNVAFDEDESMIIISKSSKNAMELALENWSFRVGKNPEKIDLVIEEVMLNKERIIEVSHFGN